MDKNNKITKKYYSNKTISKFYKEVWGGECIHVGIYKPNEITDSIENLIKTTIENKCSIMYKLIRMYNNNTNYYNIADFGSGFGGTARFISESFNKDIISNNILDYNIDCYDISKDNCYINTIKTLYTNYYRKLKIYNRSFTETYAPDNYYNHIISEDAFIHIDDKNELFKEIKRVLKQHGLLIFSDIIRTENANKNDIDEVSNRIGVSNIISDKEYRILANEYGFKLANEIEYKEDMLKHYKNIKIIAEKKLNKNYKDNTTDYKSIILGLTNWIKHIELGNITIKIYIFQNYND